MKDRALQLVADELADDSDRISRKLSDARQRLRDAMRGQPGAQVLDRGPGGSGGHSDPTAGAGLEADPARVDESTLIDALSRARAHATRALDVIERYTPRAATSIERRAVETANEPRCESCARIELVKGKPVVEIPVTKLPTNVKGNLPKPMLLCRWCHDFVCKTGRLPYRREARAHAKGERVFVHDPKGARS